MPPPPEWTAKSPDAALGIAQARASLAGNPSDGYAGAVLATTLPAWQARASAARAERLFVEPSSALVLGAVRRFAREVGSGASDVRVEWETSIPPLVGLGGSSALAIAVIRALCELRGVELDPGRVAAHGAGGRDRGARSSPPEPQDAVAQAHVGLTLMDFSGPGFGRFESLDPGLLPSLLIAWRGETGEPSDGVHSSLRERHRAGDPVVRRTMAALGQAALGARDALLAGDLPEFGRRMDETFDLRRGMIPLSGPRATSRWSRGRALTCGASANYAGSGGAIVAASGNPGVLDEVAHALRVLGCELRPTED